MSSSLSSSSCCGCYFGASARVKTDSRRFAPQKQRTRSSGGSTKATAEESTMGSSSSSSKKARALEIWRMCDAVCFDVDSTVIDHEGIDAYGRISAKAKRWRR